MTTSPEAVIATEEERIKSFVDFERHRDSCASEINGMRRALGLLTEAGLILTPERLAQERAAALGEAAEALSLPGAESDDYGHYAGEVWQGYREAERRARAWLCTRAEAERAGGGV